MKQNEPFEHYTDRSQQADQLARAVIDLTRGRLLTCFPYMNLAILHMPAELVHGGPLLQAAIRQADLSCCETDGKTIRWEAEDILKRYARGEAFMNRPYLHMLLHCIFLHPFAYSHLDTDLWDAAADIAVEHIIRSMGMRELASPEDSLQEEAEKLLADAAEDLTADQIYYAMQKDPALARRLLQEAPLFVRDRHDIWRGGSAEDVPFHPSLFGRSEKNNGEEESWRRIQANVKVMQLNEADRHGDAVGQRLLDPEEVRPAFRNYARLLSRFAVPCEEASLNPEEFDYIYYNYGLQLYKKLPLVEPLEYKETRKVRELVIAIDTSGSTLGPKVRRFLSQTYAILNNTSFFHDRLNLHLIQCDCDIQADDVITSREAFVRKMRSFQIKGAGGTSFCPVFTYVQELMDRGTFHDLQGIIYFTDGYGKYPETDPGIRTAFVLYDTDCSEEDLPAWAEHIRLHEI